MKIIAMLNQKGGVGKTTSAVNIGAGLSNLGKKVLLIDLDPQANLTYSFGLQAHELNLSVYDLIKGEITVEETIFEHNGVKIIPSSLNLAGAEIELSGIPGREFLLHESIETLNSFDYVFIDCPPSLGLLTLNALTSAQEIYIPLLTEFLSMQGISKLLQTINVVKKRLNEKLEITGVLCCKFDNRKNLNKEVVDKIKEHFGSKVFNTLIRDNVSLAEAPSFGQSIFEYKSKSFGAIDYLNLCREIIDRN